MHESAYNAVAEFVASHDLNQSKAVVLEIGSYDVNGSVRPLFMGCMSYTGIDLREDPSVNLVADGATYGKKAAYDVVVTTSTLEHCADPAAVIKNAARILKPGGALILTTVDPDYPSHGNDGNELPADETYTTIEYDDLVAWLEDAGFIGIDSRHDTATYDIVACAFTPKGGA